MVEFIKEDFECIYLKSDEFGECEIDKSGILYLEQMYDGLSLSIDELKKVIELYEANK